MSEKSVIIVAGGIGTRMGISKPKQFLILKSKPVLLHTIEKFYCYDNNIKIVVVLPSNHLKTWAVLCKKYSINIPHTLVEGGSERFYSVKNGLNSLGNTKWVAIHDGVRPMISIELIGRCFEAAKRVQTAIPVVAPVETVRVGSFANNEIVARESVFLVQTPQVFNYQLLKKAYDVSYSSSFTDDASVYENSGSKVFLVEGDINNIKITKKSDIQFCNFLLSHQK